MIQTRFRELLEIDHPIVQAGMGGVAGPRLAAAVSAAGGLGMIGCYRMTTREIRAAIEQTSARTVKRFGVNFVPDVVLPADLESSVNAALDEGIRIFSFFSPIERRLIERLQGANALVFLQVGSLEQANVARDCGVDVVIVQGWEAGGHHRGCGTTLLPLLDTIRRRCPDLVLLAAGGIATGAALVAALAAGADGAWIGTRFVAATESEAHSEYKRRLVEAGAADTVVTGRYAQGWPGTVHRALRTRITDSADPVPSRICGFVEVAGSRVPIPFGSVAVPTITTSGKVEDMAHYAGQGCEFIDSVLSAREILGSIIAEAEATIARLAAACQPDLSRQDPPVISASEADRPTF